MPSPPRTPTGHHITVHNRRWRASDPAIPPKLRQELVNTLMAGRRSVRSHGARGSVARRKVQDAKVALGERGVEWWIDEAERSEAEDVSSHQQTIDTGDGMKEGKGGGKEGQEGGKLWWKLASKQAGLHARIDSTIRTLCRAREHGTVCPSEVSRTVAGDATEDWRDLMPVVRERAEGLVKRGQIEICQKGVRVEPGGYKGPIRLRGAEGIDGLDEGDGESAEDDRDAEEDEADGGDGKEDGDQGEQGAESKAEEEMDEEDKGEKDKDEEERDEEGKGPAKAKEQENGKKTSKRRHTPPTEETDSLPLRSGKRRR